MMLFTSTLWLLLSVTAGIEAAEPATLPEAPAEASPQAPVPTTSVQFLPALASPEDPSYRILVAGKPLNTSEFADLAGDSALRQRLDRERRSAARTGVVLGTTGLAFFVATFRVVLAENPDKPKEQRRVTWEGRYSDRANLALALGLSGYTFLVTAPLPALTMRARQREPALYLSREQAEKVARVAMEREAERLRESLPEVAPVQPETPEDPARH